MKKIYLHKEDGSYKPRREINVDEFFYMVTSSGGETIVILPGERTYDTGSYLVVDANGAKIYNDVEYVRSANNRITAKVSDMFPDGKFPKGCVLNFETYQ